VGNSHDGTSHFPNRVKPTGDIVENMRTPAASVKLASLVSVFTATVLKYIFQYLKNYKVKYVKPTSGHKERNYLV
jgi:hypothetical protein